MNKYTVFSICVALGAMPLQANAQLADTWNGVTDVARIWTDKLPEPAGKFAYLDEDYFDVQLHRSLKKNYHTVEVSLPADDALAWALPERIERWLVAAERHGGSVRICAPQDYWAMQTPQMLKNYYLTYRPVRNYDAFIMIDDGGHISQAIFFHKRSDRERPTHCANYFYNDEG